MNITREQAVKEFGSVTELAKALGLTKGRISHFKDKDSLPEALVNKLQLLRPNVFMSEEVKKRIIH